MDYLADSGSTLFIPLWPCDHKNLLVLSKTLKIYLLRLSKKPRNWQYVGLARGVAVAPQQPLSTLDLRKSPNKPRAENLLAAVHLLLGGKELGTET